MFVCTFYTSSTTHFRIMYQRRRSRLFQLLLLFAIAGIAACSSNKADYKSPAGYNLNQPNVLQMPAELDELSGIVYDVKDSSLLGIEDEEGFLYKIHPRRPEKIERWKFGKHGDYEDIAIAGDKLFVLRSDGNVYLTHIYSADSSVAEKYKFPESGNYEFESLYYDAAAQRLVLLCKDCAIDDKSTISSWSFSPDSLQFGDGPYKIATDDLRRQLGEQGKIKPSAAAIHPVTHELYILASISKALIVATPEGQVKAVYRLNPKYFKQAEGIAFSPEGTMYISNESARIGNATVLVFPYRTAPAAPKAKVKAKP